MRFDARTAQVMKKASRGPAAIALRQQRILRPTQTGINPVTGVIQSGLAGPARMSTGEALVRYGITGSDVVSAGTPVGKWSLAGAGRERSAAGLLDSRPFAFGAVDTAAIAQSAASKGSGIAATSGGTSLAAWAGAGSAAGPIGLVVGAIVGLAVAELLHKNYLNVAQINQAQDAQVKIFDQYRSIQGKVPGRAIGMDVMKAIWKGAQNRGYFGTHGAGVKQCFHEGCFKYPGRGDWIDSDYSNNGASWQWGGVFKNWLSGRQAGGVSAQMNYAPRSVAVAPVVARMRATLGLRGLGDVSTVSDAVSFVDNYFIPANAGRWAAPSNTFEHNMLYDLADAFLANQPGVNTTPYVAIPNAEYGGMPAPSPAVPPPAATTPAPAPVTPISSQTSVTVSYPGYVQIGPGLYLAIADGNKLNQNIPIYTPQGGKMVPTGQVFYNAATAMQPEVLPAAPPPGNTYPLVPVATPGGGTVYQQNPAQPAAATPAAAPSTNWGPLLAIGAAALTFMK